MVELVFLGVLVLALAGLEHHLRRRQGGSAGRRPTRPPARGASDESAGRIGGASTAGHGASGGPALRAVSTDPAAGPFAGKRFASSGSAWRRRPLFAHAALVAPSAPGHRHTGGYAAIGLATSGFSPMRDRAVELGVVHLDARGEVTHEWTTLLDPGGDPGPSFLHGLQPADLAFTPTFEEVARSLLARLEGRVVVAHNADLVEDFLAAEFLRATVLAPSLPALGLSRIGQGTFPTPNHRLATLAAHVGHAERPDGTALGQARLVAAVLPHLLAAHGTTLAYPIPPAAVLGHSDLHARVVPRAGPPPSRPQGWLAEVVGRISMSASEANDPRIAAYVEALTTILAEGRLVTDEARELTRLLAAAGYPAARIRDVLERLLEAMREAAFEERRLTATHVRHLRAAAVSLDLPTYFDDLLPPPAPDAPAPGSGSFSRPVRKPVPALPPARLPRCGHCLTSGHYTAACPLRRVQGSAGGPVPPIDPIGSV